MPGNRFSLAGLWLLLSLLLGAFSLQHWQAGVPLDADLFSLLPQAEQDPVVQRAQQVAESTLSRTTLLWVGTAQPNTLREDVNRIADALRASGRFASVLSGADSLNAGALASLLPWRFSLLSTNVKAQLQSSAGAQAFVEDYYQKLLRPVSAAGPIPLQQDVLGLLNEWLQTLSVDTPRIDPATGLWIGTIDNQTGAFLILINQADTFTLNAPEQLAATLADLRRNEAPHGTRIIATGAALFAAAAAEQAKSEISTVGLGSTLAALLLILWVFRSVRGLLSLLPVAYGSWLALLACDLVFDRVHLMTLVFGASLTGVSIDYALHVMADAFQSRGQWSASAAVRKLLPGLTLGMLTSVLAYACLGLAPFPGLQQVALFSGVSLFSAYLMVVITFPLCLGGFQRRHTPLLLRLISASLPLRNRLIRRRNALFAGIAVVALAGMALLQTDDNIRLLYSTRPQLQQDDAALRKAFGLSHNSQFILVEAATEEQLLQQEQRVAQVLDKQIIAHKLQRYSALSQWLPGREAQLENQSLLEQQLFSAASPVRANLASMGIDEQLLARQWQEFQSVRGTTLGVTQALQLPFAAPWKTLWLGETASGVASRISLQGATDIDALTKAISPIEGVRLIDRVESISQLLGRYRTYTGYLVVLALLATWALLVPRYGVRNAASVVTAPALAIALTIGLHGIFNLNFNLFSLFGFLIVLGMGVDYAIYFREADGHLDNTALGITLDALTTLFSFGLLSVSSTPAVSAFGTSVLLGITFSWLFAHLVGDATKANTAFVH